MLTGLLIQDREECVPLKSMSVRAFLQGYVVGFHSKLTYENSSSDPLEVFFRTPVDDSYAVVGLEAIIDGRKIKAEIQEKEKAREMYKEAIASGHTAAFGEEKKGDIFSIVLGNLPPGKIAEIQLTMVGELDVEPDGAVRFVLPTVLKPRYTPSGSTDPLAPIPSSGEKPVRHGEGPLDYKFDLIISGADAVAEVTSPSHVHATETVGQIINVIVEEDNPKDIVILVLPKEPHKPLVIVEPGMSDGENDFQKSTAVMISFFPEFKGDKSCLQAACEFVFVVDRSGSMEGPYIRDAAETLLLFLKSIPEGCYFNIVGFGSSYEKLFPESVSYNQENLEKAVKHAENLQADLGGTEIFDPLKYIFSQAQMKGLPRQVFVMTDGSVGNTESVINLVQQNSHNARCFSFGIGSGASSALVKGIARAGKGTAEFITSGERMQPKVIRSLKKAMQPAVTETEVKFTLPNGYTVQVAPKKTPAMFVGERTIIYGIVNQISVGEEESSSKASSIRLVGDLLGGNIAHLMKFKIPASMPKEKQRVATIHHLAGKRLIKDLESEERVQSKKDSIVKLSRDCGVISSLTAFIAIDVDQKVPVKGKMQQWDVLAPQSIFKLCRVEPLSMKMALSADSMFSHGCAFLSDDYEEDEDCMGMDTFSEFFAPECDYADDVKPQLILKSASSPGGETSSLLSASLSQPSQGTTEKVPTLIGQQLASGAWNLTVELAAVLDKTTDVIKKSCPVPCEGDMESIWGTILALCYLEQKQSALKEEWELVAAKADAWLAKQSLPKGCSVQGLREKASDTIN